LLLAMGRPRHPKDLPDRILDAADRLLARSGYQKLTIDDLAREVGIGKGTVYLHFRSKEEIVLSRIDRVVRRLTEQLLAIAKSSATPDDKLRRMLLTRVMFRFDSVQHYTESISEVLRALRSGLLERHQKHFEQEARVFAKVLKEGQDAGVFHNVRGVRTARVLLVATNSLLPFSLSTQELGSRRAVENNCKEVADVLVAGLLAPASRN
jgi:AcrR family transcriptional regulator